MSAAKKCDRCKEFYEPFNPGFYIVKGPLVEIVDLCPNCTDTLIKWLKGDVQMIVFTGDEEAADDPEQASE
jgi:hypothetical protein